MYKLDAEISDEAGKQLEQYVDKMRVGKSLALDKLILRCTKELEQLKPWDHTQQYTLNATGITRERLVELMVHIDGLKCGLNSERLEAIENLDVSLREKLMLAYSLR